MPKTLTHYCLYAILILPLFSLGQSKPNTDYIVLTAGDTLYGTVDYLDERGTNPKFYKKIRFTNSEGKRKKYRQHNVLAFKSGHKAFEAFWLSNRSERIVLFNPIYRIDTQKGSHEFLRVMHKGNLSYYELEWWDQGEAGINGMALLKKTKDSFFIRADQGLFGLNRKALANYFKDCPELATQITTKTIKKVWDILDFYNLECGITN
ncbi:MAG: hypothetical protein AB8B52_12045 [Winogradskyella sp.]|uniref:hypothetical protein n=1 Tax=Winogradskyella sp. TaxID=1883156 RepID=UPI00385F9EF1